MKIINILIILAILHKLYQNPDYIDRHLTL